MHDVGHGPNIISPRSPPLHCLRSIGSLALCRARIRLSPVASIRSQSSQLIACRNTPATRRSASIADLVAVSEMSEAEHDRHREAHRHSAQYGDESMTGHSMSRSSSASGGFQGPSVRFPTAPLSSYFSSASSSDWPHRTQPQYGSPAQRGHRGALFKDRPRSAPIRLSRHMYRIHHAALLQPMSPLGHPAAHLQQYQFHTLAIALQVATPWLAAWILPCQLTYQRLSAWHASSEPIHAKSRCSSPGLGPSHVSHPVERARYASQTARSVTVPCHALAQTRMPTPAHPPVLPRTHRRICNHRHRIVSQCRRSFVRSPESRRVPLPHSPTSVHQAHPHSRTSLSHDLRRVGTAMNTNPHRRACHLLL